MDTCLGCAFASGQKTPPGGVLLRTDSWMVNHCVGPLGLGTMVIAPTRHVTRVSALTEPEVEELGRLIRRCSQVVETLVTAEQTYVCLWSHGTDGPKHLHWVVQPITKDLVEAHAGKRSEELQSAMLKANEHPSRDDIETVCSRARIMLTQG